jgi:glycosyltransferase involved in cell wall biosynthesis
MPLEKKYDIMKNAHCFILPSTFNKHQHTNYKYSFPTKLPELLASGRPILSYGPEDTAVNHLLRDINGGILVNDRSVEILSNNLVKIVRNYHCIIEQSMSLKTIVKERFSANSVRRKLKKILS